MKSVKKTKNLFFSGVIVLTVANLLVKLIGATLKIPLTGIIGNQGMGIYSNAYDVYVWLYMISTAGIPVAISIMISKSRTKGNFKEATKIFKIALTLFIIIGFTGMSLMIGFSKWIEQLYKYQGTGFYLAVIAIAPTLFFICISSAIRGFFQGYQDMFPTAISEVIESLGKLVLGLLFASYSMRLIPETDNFKIAKVAALTIFALTLGVLISTVYLIIRKLRFNDEPYNAEFRRPDSDLMPVRSYKELLKTLILIAVPIMISSSIMSFTTLIDGMILSSRLHDLGITEKLVLEIVGAYKTQVVTIANLPPALIYPISASIVPYLSSAVVTGDKKRIHHIMNSSLRVAALIAIPCALGLSVLSGPIIRLIYGESFKDMPTYLSIQALTVFLIAVLAMTTSILQANKLERKPIISMLVGSAVKLISSYIMVGNKNIQVLGAPISTLLCYLTIVTFNLYFVAKYVGFIPNFRRIFIKPLIASVVCAAAALGSYTLLASYISSKIAVLLAISIAGVVYILTVFLIKAIDYDDVMLVPKGDKIYKFLHKCRLM